MSNEDRHALVCGASRGIGAAVAQRLAADGFCLTLLARNESALHDVAAGLANSSSHDFVAIDVADSTALGKMISEKSRRRPYTVLINNSGGPPPGSAAEADPDSYLAAFRQHLVANQVLLQALLPGMKQVRHGRIVNIISTSVKEPIAGLGVSNTIRAAVAGWAKTLARELGPHGITVNNVLPGYTDTERLQQIFAHQAQRAERTVDEIIELRRAEVPVGRFAEPAEIAAAVAFLASDEAAYVNGINLPVDGGRTRSQ
ncbi:MAG: SDR family oxidoreductase [Gammaproteobacteria bacterium]|nr:SDR family oxidoreductase [Gammaproteobacteria bacterium]NNM20240.1 SDR family oxidoreductase [Gammaproteobacteria bacterium]